MLLLLAAQAVWAGEVSGRLDVAQISKIHGVSVRLLPIGPFPGDRVATVDEKGSFDFLDVPAGSFLMQAQFGSARFFLKQIRVAAEERVDAGALHLPVTVCEPPDCFADTFGIVPPPPDIVDVCGALKQINTFGEIVIVGVVEDTATGPALVGPCKKQRTADGYTWQNLIGLPGFSPDGIPDLSQMPDWKRIVDAQGRLARLAAAARRFGHASNPRVVALYGRLSSEAPTSAARLGLVKCSKRVCPADIQYPGADLVYIEGLREIK